MMRKIAAVLLFILIIGMIVYHSFPIIPYLIEQGKGQATMIWESRDLNDVLEDTAVNDTVKNNLKKVEDIRNFAFEELGLTRNNNYTRYYHIKEENTLLVLTAAEAYSFKAYEWSFPIIGSVAYKGFFNHQRGRIEESELSKLGYDTDFSKVSAWSTLGWFKDPVTSGMLKRTEGELVNLIIHELAHGTIYIKSNTELNENLATFIGDEGALLFLTKKYGENSDELLRYISRKKDEKIFSNYILEGMQRLQKLYSNFPVDASETYKTAQKYNLIASLYNGIADLPLNNIQQAQISFGKDPYPNNTYFMSFKRYQEKQAEIEEKYKSLNQNIKDLITYYKSQYPQ